MSTVVAEIEEGRQAVPTSGGEAAAWAVAIGSVAFLVFRPAVASHGDAALALGYVGIGGACALLLRRSPSPIPGQRRSVALAVGLAAIALARIAAGPAPPLALSASVVLLNTLAAIAEEAFFRGFLFARLSRLGIAVAVVVSAVSFALLHLPQYGVASFPVDLGAGLLLSWQRAASRTWTVPAATHAFANLLAVLR